jgi:hypothetical protein
VTNGGPADATLFYSLQIYRQAFQFCKMGYASAMAWILFVLVMAATLLIFRTPRLYSRTIGYSLSSEPCCAGAALEHAAARLCGYCAGIVRGL